MKNLPKIILVSLFVFFLGSKIVFAQENLINLKLSRDFGYSSGAGKIQGLFSMKVTSPEQLIEVKFFIDSTEIGVDDTEPFKLQFNTDNYSPGVHSIRAVALTVEGKELKTNEIIAEFVSPEESKNAVVKILIPILGLSLAIILVSVLVPAITTRKNAYVNPGTPRNYGVAGGTICSRCDRPFPRHMLAPNLLAGKLERCPHCGKWGIFRAYSLDRLRKAEEAELDINTDQSASGNDDGEDKIHGDLDSTKYQDL